MRPSRALVRPVALTVAFAASACGGEEGPVAPRLIVSDQTLSPPNVLVIEQAGLPSRGFVVVREDAGGTPGATIGSQGLGAGEHFDVQVPLERAGRDGETLFAVLYRDTGEADVYEFDQDSTLDPPFTNEAGDVVKATFTISVDVEAIAPEIRALAQAPNPADEVVVAFARSAGPGFVVVHEDASGEIGDALGHVAVDTGEHTGLSVRLSREVRDRETLHAVLHVDDGEIGTYEFDGNSGLDDPVLDPTGAVVASPFVVEVPVVVGPSVEADDQTVEVLSRVVVRRARSAGPGWVVVHEDDGGTIGAVLGHAPVATGTTSDVNVELSREVRDGETLYAMLHVDDGEVGAFEFDGVSGVDAPATAADGQVVVDDFVVRFEASVDAFDQEVDPVDVVTVSSAVLDGPGWLVIRADDGGPAEILGQAPLQHGTNQDVPVPLSRAVVDAEILYATLHTDDGVVGTFEFDGENGLDAPIEDDAGNPVAAPFVVTFFGAVRVSDQFLDPPDAVTVAEVVSAGPGFVVIHEDDEGVIGAVIGVAEVGNGANLDVVVELDRAVRQKERLYAMLHRDTNMIGVYEFEGLGSPDGPVLDRAGEVVAPAFEVRFVDLEVFDQSVDPTTEVTIAAVSSNGPGFVVVQADAGGSPGEVLGSAPVQTGTTANVVVPLSRSVVFDERLHATLHVDVGQVGVFEPGDAMDVPAELRGQPVRSALAVRFAPKVVASDQVASPATTVVVDDVISGGPGWVVIREAAANGTRGAAIGYAPLVNGTNTAVSVSLDRPAVDGETLWAVLHVDRGQPGVLEISDPFAPPDAEVNVNGVAVQATFSVTVP